ncbi:hypothetical protein BC332_18157 [Capsicum chinense]|nr:hypothetical protein BC332_18157 [Capsicum chinense]
MSVKVAKRKHFQIENNGFSQSNQMDFQIDQQVSSDLGCYLKLSFAWLPVRSLLRFKCVTKYWDALISDPYFEMKHRSSPESKSEKLLIRQRSTTQCERKIHLVSFDISNEVFGVLPLLEEMFIGVQGLPDIGISLLDGMLCFHITADGDNLSYTFKLWAMKDYGVKESWMVLFTIQAYDLVTVKPRYRFPDGDVLLYSPGELPHQGLKPWTLTFQTSKGKFGCWPRRESFEKGIVYTKSLVSPKLVM